MDTGRIGFFTPIAAMEEGSGFAIGSPFHIAYLALSALLVCTLVITYRHLRPGIRGKTPRRIMLLCVSLTATGLKMSELAIMMAWGVYNVFWWPLHPCNICVLLCVLFAIVPNNPTGEVLYALGIPGGMAGLLFADWIGRTTVVLNWFCLCGFVEHSAPHPSGCSTRVSEPTTGSSTSPLQGPRSRPGPASGGIQATSSPSRC